MRKFIVFIALLSLVACKKRKENQCSGELVFQFQRDPRTSVGSVFSYDEVKGTPKVQYYGGGDWQPRTCAYNHYKKLYYGITDDDGVVKISKVAFSTEEVTYVAYRGTLDSPGWKGQAVDLFCDSKRDRLYYVGKACPFIESADRIYELVINGDSCRERFLYRATPGDTINSPVIDEASGDIFFQSGKNMVRLDAGGGTIKQSWDYGSVQVKGLQYANGSFYGVDKSTSPVWYLKVDPSNGHIDRLRELPYYAPGIATTFDHCSNQFIIVTSAVYFLEAATGKKIKEYRESSVPLDAPAYVNK
ncbi:MAG: hypothetical protein KF744_07835 [Taibaiella sp.]|nr:hypothetical protein [Taibaiella sp.]